MELSELPWAPGTSPELSPAAPAPAGLPLQPQAEGKAPGEGLEEVPNPAELSKGGPGGSITKPGVPKPHLKCKIFPNSERKQNSCSLVLHSRAKAELP